MLVTEHLIKLHSEFDGVCQECNQRCDKSVISIKQKDRSEIVVCPDCVAGKTKAVFQVSDQLVYELLHILPDYTFDNLKSLLLSFPHQYALVKYSSRSRVYWSWDKSQLFKTVHINHLDQIMRITFHNNRLNNKLKNTFNGIHYNFIGNRMVPINQITIPKKFLDTQVRSEKIEKQINYFKIHGQFSGIKVEQIGPSKWSLIDGYSRYCAASQLELTNIVTEELSQGEKELPSNFEGDTIFNTYTFIRKSNSSQEHFVTIVIYRWRNKKIKRKITLDYGSFKNEGDALFSINMIRESLINKEYFKQLEELKLPRLSLSYSRSGIMIRYGLKKTIIKNIGLWSEGNFAQLYKELKICLQNPFKKHIFKLSK